MTKFKSLARKMGRDMPSISSIKNEVYYPHISFNEKEVPEILDWKIGGEYEVVIKIKQTSIMKDKDRSVSADFDITGIAVQKDNSKDDKVKRIGEMLIKRKSKDY